MTIDDEGGYVCGIADTAYRGEEHSIWLRMSLPGYQVVNLDDDATFRHYLNPRGRRIPVFPLMGVLYSTRRIPLQANYRHSGIRGSFPFFHRPSGKAI